MTRDEAIKRVSEDLRRRSTTYSKGTADIFAAEHVSAMHAAGVLRFDGEDLRFKSTRDEALAAVALAAKQNRDEPLDFAAFLVDALFALGVLELGEVPVIKWPIMQEGWKERLSNLGGGLVIDCSDPKRVEITPAGNYAPPRTLRMVVNEIVPEGIEVAWNVTAPPPARCEPPPEHADKSWHWLRHRHFPKTIVVRMWTNRRDLWLDFTGHEISATDMHGELQFDYIAPCLPPEDVE